MNEGGQESKLVPLACQTVTIAFSYLQNNPLTPSVPSLQSYAQDSTISADSHVMAVETGTDPFKL